MMLPVSHILSLQTIFLKKIAATKAKVVTTVIFKLFKGWKMCLTGFWFSTDVSWIDYMWQNRIFCACVCCSHVLSAVGVCWLVLRHVEQNPESEKNVTWRDQMGAGFFLFLTFCSGFRVRLILRSFWKRQINDVFDLRAESRWRLTSDPASFLCVFWKSRFNFSMSWHCLVSISVCQPAVFTTAV